MTAYSGDLGEELDGSAWCVGGIVTGVRTVHHQGPLDDGRRRRSRTCRARIEVVVFPKVYEQTDGDLAEGAILLVAGRVDHKGDETVLLADAVWTWEEARRWARQSSPASSAGSIASGGRGP